MELPSQLNQIISKSLDSNLGAAFFGAFFAFIFGGIAFSRQKNSERRVKHMNAVVALEYLLNEHLDDISVNMSQAKGSADHMSSGKFTYNQFYPLRIPIGLELELGDIDLINRYVDYRTTANKINHDFESLNRAVDLTHKAVISGIPPSALRTTLEHLSYRCTEVVSGLEMLNSENMPLLVFVRLYLSRYKNLVTSTYWRLKTKNWSGIIKKDIEIQTKVLEEEIRKVSTQSKNVINKFMKRDGAKS